MGRRKCLQCSAGIIALFLTFGLFFPVVRAEALGNVTDATSRIVAAYFELARRNEAELVAFLHRMPKGADLHNHPSGAYDTEIYLDNAIGRGLLYDRTLRKFVESTANPHYTPHELKYDFQKTAEVLNALSMRESVKDAETGHTRFFMSFSRYGNTGPSAQEGLEFIVKRAIDQRIGYLELMTNPVEIEKDMDFGRAREELAELHKSVRRLCHKYRTTEGVWGLEVAFSLTLNRGYLPPELRANFDESAYESYFREQVRSSMRAVVELNDLGVRAVTILSPEDSWFSRTFFDLQMRVIDEEYRDLSAQQRELVKLNLHAGELTIGYSPLEVMTDRIRRTIVEGHASRIGHGTSIAWENDVYGLLALMRDRRIAVEIIPSSSEGILGVSHARHPFPLYDRFSVPIVIATDDEGISRSNMTLEYARIAQWYGLKYGQMKWLAFSSLEYSFLPGDSLFPEGDFNRARPFEEVADSRKAQKQLELLHEFTRFESWMESNIERIE